MDKSIKKESRKLRRTLRSGAYTAVISAALVAVLVFVNLIMTALPANIVKLDMTSNGMFSLGDTTREVLEGVTDEVAIYHIYEDGSENTSVSRFLERYETLNSNIKVSAVDPAVNPNFTQQFTDEDVYNNTLIIVGPQRNTLVYETDMYKYYVEGQYMSYSDYYYYNQYMSMYYGSSASAEEFFFGEQEITSAIDYVTAESIPVMYYTSKHGETEISDNYAATVKNENIKLDELDLVAAESIPEDAEALIINAPTMDFTAEECDLLMDYMSGGGNVVLLTNYTTEINTEMPNLAALVNDLGLASVDGLLVEEDAGSYYRYPYFTLPDINESSAPAQLMKSTNVYVYMPYAHGITISDDAPYVATPILTTSETSYIKPADTSTATKEEGDPQGQFHTGVYVSLVSSEVETTVTDAGSFVWYSTNELINDQYINAGNGDLFISTLNTMCDKTSSISIIGKSLDSGFLTLDAVSSITWQVILTVVLPVGVLVIGLTVWYKRRRK